MLTRSDDDDLADSLWRIRGWSGRLGLSHDSRKKVNKSRLNLRDRPCRLKCTCPMGCETLTRI